MIYREDSIKNLMNNSIVRYNDSAVLDVSLNLLTNLFSLFCARKQKNRWEPQSDSNSRASARAADLTQSPNCPALARARGKR